MAAANLSPPKRYLKSSVRPDRKRELLREVARRRLIATLSKPEAKPQRTQQ